MLALTVLIVWSIVALGPRVLARPVVPSGGDRSVSADRDLVDRQADDPRRSKGDSRGLGARRDHRPALAGRSVVGGAVG